MSPVDRADRYLEAAAAVGRWLVDARIDLPSGPGWPIMPGDPTSIDPTLYGAGAGVALYLAELAAATGDGAVGEQARLAARAVARGPSARRYGLYSGLAGMVLAVSRVADVLEDEVLRSRAATMLADLVSAAEPADAQDEGRPPGSERRVAGVEWPAWPNGRGPWRDLIHGTAGIVLVLDALSREDVALAAGRRLARLAIPSEGGRWWRSRPDDSRPAPNMAHGTAGISFALATLAMRSGDGELRDAAIDGGRHLLSIARTAGGTCAVHHHEPDGLDEYHFGWCSGPAGLCCLFRRLHQLTGEDEWWQWALRAAATVSGSGLPGRLWPGFWDNVGMCCGSAGVAETFLGLHSVTGDGRHLAFAVEVLDDVLDRAEERDRRMWWHNVDHLAPRSVLPAQTGWMQGAAGVGMALLRGASVLRGDGTGWWLPSWPFGE